MLSQNPGKRATRRKVVTVLKAPGCVRGAQKTVLDAATRQSAWPSRAPSGRSGRAEADSGVSSVDEGEDAEKMSYTEQQSGLAAGGEGEVRERDVHYREDSVAEC